jgi:galactokinase
VIDRLLAHGLSPIEAERKTQLFVETARVVQHAAGADPDTLRHWFIPGRIEVLGKHTDYAGGRSLLCAVERGFCVSASPRSDNVLHVTDVRNGVDARFVVSEDQPAEMRWRNYIATVARRVSRNFPGALRGANIAFASDLPRSAGLSSSTALIIGIFTVLTEVNALARHPAYTANILDREALASYLGCVENGRTFGTLIGDSGVGTKGGSQDHTAVLCSEAGYIVAQAYSPPRRERILPMPAGCAFVIGSSGVAAEKTGDALADYNRAAAAVSALVDLAGGVGQQTLYDLVASRASGAGAADLASQQALHAAHASRRTGVLGPRELDAASVARLREIINRTPHPHFTSEALTARLDQFVLETFQIIPAAGDALGGADLATFGDLVDRSQAAAELWLGNQIPETIALARLARTQGAIAASAFGAGFGGSVWALVPEAEAATFLDVWRTRYLANFPDRLPRAEFFVTSAGPPLFRV